MKRVQFWMQKGRQIAAFLKPMTIPLHSAYTSFFLILSLFPSLMLLLGVLRATQIRLADVTAFLEGFLPQALLPTAQALLQASYRSEEVALVSISAITALWSASRGMYGMVNGLHAIYGDRKEKGYWHRRILSMLYTFLFLVVLLLTLVAHIFGTAILDYLWMTTSPALMVLMSIVDLRFVLLLLLQTLLFTAMYALLSGPRRPARDCFPGAVVASLGWLLFSRLFSVYVKYFAGYANVFGSIYALALGMLWLYFCICIVFYGSAFNRFLVEKGK